MVINENKLLFFHRTVCDTGFKGKYCSQRTKCVPRDDSSGHYTCSKNNEVVCIKGWINPQTGCTKGITTFMI